MTDKKDQRPQMLEPATNARNTVVLTAHSELMGEQPVTKEYRFEDRYRTEDDDQAWSRIFKVGTKPVNLLDGCWLESYGMVIIANKLPTRNVNPELEELEADRRRIIRLPNTKTRIPPGQFTIIHPDEDDALEVYCDEGTVRVEVTVYPTSELYA